MLEKEEIKKEVKERLDYKTISPVWKKIFSISGVVFFSRDGRIDLWVIVTCRAAFGD